MSFVCHPGAELQEIAGQQGQPATDQIKIFNDLLQAVCAKLVVKIRELDRVNADLRNLIEASPIPAIFIDESLVIRDFTPATRKVCPISARDVGDSLLKFAGSINYPELEDDFRLVAQTGETAERYIEGRNGTMHYSVRMMPSFCRDKSLGGATVTFVEIMTPHSGRA
jgi:two-component system CheB/CheR fusion protein